MFQSSKNPNIQSSKVPKIQKSKVPKFQKSKNPKFGEVARCSSHCNAVAASCSARMAKSPDRRQAMYGMPSGPGAELPDIRMALAMSFCCTCQSYWRVGNRGRLWFVLGMSVLALLWSSVVRCSSSSLSEVGGDVFRGVEVAVGVVGVSSSGGCDCRVGGGILLS